MRKNTLPAHLYNDRYHLDVTISENSITHTAHVDYEIYAPLPIVKTATAHVDYEIYAPNDTFGCGAFTSNSISQAIDEVRNMANAYFINRVNITLTLAV